MSRPADVAALQDAIEGTDARGRVKVGAKLIAGALDGRAPGAIETGERARLQADFGGETAWRLVELVYPRARAAARSRGEPGKRLAVDWPNSLTLLYPRARALRTPFTADPHARGPVKGEDVYGRIEASFALRGSHMAWELAACAAVKQNGIQVVRGRRVTRLTQGAAGFILRACVAGGGAEYRDGRWSLFEYTGWKCEAEGDHPFAGPMIPGARLFLDELGWVDLADYDEARAELPDSGRPSEDGYTLELELAPDVADALDEGRARPRSGRAVIGSLGVLRVLPPFERRQYLYWQARHKDGDGRKHAYLAAPWRLTMGLRGGSTSWARRQVETALDVLSLADHRYEGYAKPHLQPNTRDVWHFAVKVSEKPSAPTELARRVASSDWSWEVWRAGRRRLREALDRARRTGRPFRLEGFLATLEPAAGLEPRGSPP